MGAIPQERGQGGESYQRESRTQVSLPVTGEQGRDADEGTRLCAGGDEEREETAQIKTDYNGRTIERSNGCGNGREMIAKRDIATPAGHGLLVQVKRPACPTPLRKSPRDFLPYPASRP